MTGNGQGVSDPHLEARDDTDRQNRAPPSQLTQPPRTRDAAQLFMSSTARSVTTLSVLPVDDRLRGRDGGLPEDFLNAGLAVVRGPVPAREVPLPRVSTTVQA
jgi:hypothetical protein